MKIIRNKILPIGKHYVAINLFGILFIKGDYPESKRLLNHERIHTYQMKEMLYVFFYIWYIVEYLIRLAICWNPTKAYRNISFEREAYSNQCKYLYLKGTRKRFGWFPYLKSYNGR